MRRRRREEDEEERRVGSGPISKFRRSEEHLDPARNSTYIIQPVYVTVCWLVINLWWFGGGTLWNIDKCFNNWHNIKSYKTSIFKSYVILYTNWLNSHIQLCISHKCKHTNNMILTTSQSVNQSTTVMPNSKINCSFSFSGKLYSTDWQLGYLCFETTYQSHFQGSSSPNTINSAIKRLTTNLMVREQEGQNTSNGKVFTLKHYTSAIPWA